MKGYHVYSKIQQFRSAGFSQRQVARRLGINRKTVKRYWEMPVEVYSILRTVMKVREKKRKNVVNILTCVLSALGAIGLLLFYGSLPSKDNIQIGNLHDRLLLYIHNFETG